MDDGAERLVWLVVLLPLAASTLQLATRSLSQREGRWMPAVGLALALLCAQALLVEIIASGDAVRGGAIRLLEPSRHALRSAGDLDGNGRLSQAEVAALQPQDGWIGLSPGGAKPHRLLLGARVVVDHPGAVLLALLALVGAALTWQLAAAKAGRGASATSLSLCGVSLSLLMLSCAVDSFLFALLLWLAGALVALVVQHADTFEGAPNPLGVGSFLLVGVLAAACLGALALTGTDGGDWRWSSLAGVAPLGGTAAAGLLVAALLIPALVFPLRMSSPKGWAPSQALAVGAVAPVAALILLRARPLFESHPLALPLLAVLGGTVALVCGARALAKDRVDRALSWVGAAQFGGLLVAVSLGSPSLVAALALAHGAALVGLVLAAEAARDSQASWRLADLGGLARGRPILGAGLFLCALAFAGAPTSGGYHALRGALDLAVDGGGVWAVAVGVWFGGALLAAVCLLRVAFLTCRGRRAARAGASLSVAPLVLAVVAFVLCKPALGLGPWDPAIAASGSAAAGVGVALFCCLALGGARLFSRTRPAPAERGSWRWLLGHGEQRFEGYAPQRRIVQPILRVAIAWRERETRLFEAPLARLAGVLWPLRGVPAAERAPAREPSAWGAVADSGLLLVFLALVWSVVRT